MKLRYSDITSIANGRAFDRMVIWGLVWSILWAIVVTLIAVFVNCPSGCWVSFVLLLGWFLGLLYKFLRTARTIKREVFEEIESDPEIELLDPPSSKLDTNKKEDRDESI